MAEHVHPDETLNPHARGHQEDRIEFRTIFLFGVGLTTVVVLVFLILAAMMGRFSAIDERSAEAKPALFADEEGLYPGPRVQEAPDRDWQLMKAEVDERLNSYGWVDREARLAHIPIDLAIQMTARDLASEAGAKE